MKIKDLKKLIRNMNDEKEVFIALETVDKNGIDIIICYDIKEEPSENAGNLQINITDKKNIQGTM